MSVEGNQVRQGVEVAGERAGEIVGGEIDGRDRGPASVAGDPVPSTFSTRSTVPAGMVRPAHAVGARIKVEERCSLAGGDGGLHGGGAQSEQNQDNERGDAVRQWRGFHLLLLPRMFRPRTLPWIRRR